MRMGKDSTAKAMATLIHWDAIWIRAIAWAWTDEHFKARLLADPKTTFENDLLYPIENHDIDLEIIEVTDPDLGWENQGVSTTKDPWEGLPNMKLTLYLPPPPANPEDRAVALADYADTGRTYPFSSV